MHVPIEIRAMGGYEDIFIYFMMALGSVLFSIILKFLYKYNAKFAVSFIKSWCWLVFGVVAIMTTTIALFIIGVIIFVIYVNLFAR